MPPVKKVAAALPPSKRPAPEVEGPAKKAKGHFQKSIEAVDDAIGMVRDLDRDFKQELQQAMKEQYELGRKHMLASIVSTGGRVLDEEGEDITDELVEFVNAGEVLERLYRMS